MIQVSPVELGILISSHYEKDDKKFDAYIKQIITKVEKQDASSAKILRKRVDGSYKNEPQVTLDSAKSEFDIGDKIYYIDYEESKASYTIEKIENVSGCKKYVVHADNLPKECGYYPIFKSQIDSGNIRDRFFSSPELAHEGYVKFKEWLETKNSNNTKCIENENLEEYDC